METLLAMLLYLSLIISGGTYYESDITDLERNHQQSIDDIRQNPASMSIVDGTYRPLVPTVIIRINPHQE